LSWNIIYIKGTVTDVNGNGYHTVKIGTQIWMVENLKAASYRYGDPIPEFTGGPVWITLTTGASLNYNNDFYKVSIFGRLYNWYAVDDFRGLAPSGWHVPSDSEWQLLVDYLGGDAVAGGKMKETGTAHWNSPNYGATNESGFSAIQSGYFVGNSLLGYVGYRARYWSSTERDNNAWYLDVSYNSSAVFRALDFKRLGYSIRCVKD